MAFITKVAALAIGIPTTLTAIYLLSLHRDVSQHVIAETKLRQSRAGKTLSSIRKPNCMPTDVADDNSEWIVAYERVTSRPIPVSHLQPAPLSTVLTKYIRATMTAFGNTPQVFLLKRMMPKKDLVTAETFSRERIQSLDFEVGDRVHGVWRVAYRGSGNREDENAEERQRVELLMEAPGGYRGPVVEGVVVVGVERMDESRIVFVNETWMWRRPEGKSLMLESAAGRWLHTLLSSWLVKRGVDALFPGRKEKEA
ncbi:hypothetical protein B0T16DRAFT_246927 [Cercophora newfieldiana]|uniref:Uncharacterized protein n=1 Tax=Cercophora newfieldiana TaxID=92897 RepID=A0AA39XU11_9PEZI|nr:hypothetical protein B0T16DRAFT_246927 [Cercophora newfieldiana]